ncbi:hypothetical protein B0H13DRAFT_1865605 [Mycena leptocephala]|nr:hypothetical protein B0H13DRAFT_1865605 [Mycena leptocephala]
MTAERQLALVAAKPELARPEAPHAVAHFLARVEMIVWPGSKSEASPAGQGTDSVGPEALMSRLRLLELEGDESGRTQPRSYHHGTVIVRATESAPPFQLQYAKEPDINWPMSGAPARRSTAIQTYLWNPSCKVSVRLTAAMWIGRRILFQKILNSDVRSTITSTAKAPPVEYDL